MPRHTLANVQQCFSPYLGLNYAWTEPRQMYLISEPIPKAVASCAASLEIQQRRAYRSTHTIQSETSWRHGWRSWKVQGMYDMPSEKEGGTSITVYSIPGLLFSFFYLLLYRSAINKSHSAGDVWQLVSCAKDIHDTTSGSTRPASKAQNTPEPITAWNTLARRQE